MATLLIKHISTYGILAKHTRSPLPKLSSTETVHTVAYGDHGIEAFKEILITDNTAVLYNLSCVHGGAGTHYHCYGLPMQMGEPTAVAVEVER